MPAPELDRPDLSADELRLLASQRQAQYPAIQDLIVDRLDLPIDPSGITNDQPLIGRGLELDSVDTLELIIGIEGIFDVSLTDEEVGAFGSVARLAQRLESETASTPIVLG